jgi:hypothetical protein
MKPTMECIFPVENDVRIRKVKRVKFEQIIKMQVMQHTVLASLQMRGLLKG